MVSSSSSTTAIPHLNASEMPYSTNPLVDRVQASPRQRDLYVETEEGVPAPLIVGVVAGFAILGAFFLAMLAVVYVTSRPGATAKLRRKRESSKPLSESGTSRGGGGADDGDADDGGAGGAGGAGGGDLESPSPRAPAQDAKKRGRTAKSSTAGEDGEDRDVESPPTRPSPSRRGEADDSGEAEAPKKPLKMYGKSVPRHHPPPRKGEGGGGGRQKVGRDRTKKSKRTTKSSSTIEPRRQTLKEELLEDFDYDEMYENPGNWDPPKISTDDSMVRHVLHEIITKKTTDISKIALPAFILEPRSAVESFADFLRPDLLAGITELDSSQERMVQVVKAFLAGFLQMRGRNNLARKPFNPVLGEYFRCVWDVDKNVSASAQAKPLSLMRLRKQRKKTDESATPDAHRKEGERMRADDQTGLLPADANQMNVIGEQVSHHPPISAFYAECPAAGVKVYATMYAKAEPDLKFSLTPLKGVKVKHEGSVQIKDCVHEERYRISFPDAYCSNVLDVPQLDFTGEASIESDSGYSAVVEFKKPHKDEDRFKIEGKVKKEDKSILSFAGKWNDKVYIDDDDEKRSMLIDLGSLPSMVKQCRTVADQDWLESRRLWRKVTKALTEKNSEEANQEKHKIEERHRRLTVLPSFFKQVGEMDWRFGKKTAM